MGKAVENVNPGRKRARFTKAFKLEAVKLLEAGQKPATQIALELGIRRNQLHKWQAQLRSNGEAGRFEALAPSRWLNIPKLSVFAAN